MSPFTNDRPSETRVPEPLTLGQLNQILIRHWALLLLGLLLGGLVGFGATQLMTPVYTATATQLVKGIPAGGVAANYDAAQYAVSRAKSYPSFVHSQSVLEGVRSDLGNTVTLEDLRTELSADNPTDTPLISISATGETPEEARDKANSAAKYMSEFVTQIESVGGKAPISLQTAVKAGPPLEPTSPNTSLMAALGAVVGLALASGAALVHALARSVRRRSDAQPDLKDWRWQEPADAEPPKIGRAGDTLVSPSQVGRAENARADR